uniref:Uncharacterized protein n=1 Tax=Panagrolaimus sp. ES5 TaxID=591445 RepID=A0AC34FY70_9BILA
RSTKPNWAPQDPKIHATLSFLTLAPLGYATYRMSALLQAAKNPRIWTNSDYINAGLISAIPIGVGLTELKSAGEDGYLRKFFERSTKPNWAPQDPKVHATLSFLTLAPLGYATYRVIKMSSGLATTPAKAAIGLYGLHALLTNIYGTEVSKQNHSNVAMAKAGVAGAAVAFAMAYKNVDRMAFRLSIPHVAYAIFAAIYHYDLYRLSAGKPMKSL